MHFHNTKATLIEKGNVVLIEEEICNCPADSVIVEVAYCGICGSDLPRFFDGKIHFYPIVLGHEFSGKIVNVGDDVQDFKEGDFVAGIPLIPCMSCNSCRTGNYQLCESYSFTGSRTDGAFQRYIIVKSENVIKLDPKVDLLDAAFIEPLTVAIHAAKLAQKDLSKRSNIVIFGYGVIGYCLSVYLLHKGFSNITVVTNSEKHKNLSEQLGITRFLTVDKYYSRGECDVLFDCTPASNALETVLPFMNSKGTVIIIGSKFQDCVISSSSFGLIQRKELKIFGSWMSYSSPWPGDEWMQAVDVLYCKKGNFKSLVQKIYPLEQTNEAFEAVRTFGPKILISPN